MEWVGGVKHLKVEADKQLLSCLYLSRVKQRNGVSAINLNFLIPMQSELKTLECDILNHDRLIWVSMYTHMIFFLILFLIISTV